ncbi:(2Fe-2S)-binding protein [Streptomyces sp. NPDC089915]|uniref:(2Fe-2S)-binding protein n=1 Tax=Streptomyces sp. NPDC089915 TaxID=3155186 RepID=UPI00341539FE
MSENENVSGTTGDTGHTGNGGGADAAAGAGWGWEPVPQGGDYDSDATAFVQLPQDMLDALDSGEPLAAPGHGFVPPPMIMPLGSSGSTDPSATGTWTMPVQWPEAGGAPAQAPADPGPARAPIPASIPLPASVAAAFAAAEPEGQAEFHGGAQPDASHAAAQPGPHLASQAGAHGAAQQQHAQQYADAQYGDPRAGTDMGATAEWQFPDALHRDEDPSATGHWTLPADLTGGAAAGAGAGGVGGDGFGGDGLGGEGLGQGGLGRDGLGGDGLGQGGLGGDGLGQGGLGRDGLGGTGEFRTGAHDSGWGGAPGEAPGASQAPWAAPEAPAGAGASAVPEGLLSSGVLPGEGVPGAHGAAAGPTGRGPRVLGGPGVGTPLPEGYHQAGPEPETALEAAPDIEASHGHGPAQPPAGDERPRPAEAEAEGADAAPEEGPAPAAVPGEAHAHGFGEGPGAPAGAEAAPVPDEDTAGDAVVAPAAHDTGEFPLGEAAYGEERHPAVAQHEHPAASYVLRVNGADRPVTGAWIGESLLYVLRERLGLAGAKDGCSQGECGACAVQVDGRLVASCLVPAATAAGSEVRTVEGLAQGGELSDVQQALCRSGGVQCGFCVPGMAMTIHDLLEGNHAPSELETRQALCGNLCRCSGYKGVIEAVREVIAERETTAAQAAETPAEPLIPHQAQPGEGGVHAFDPTAFGGHGFDASAAGPGGTLGGNGNGFDAAAQAPSPDGLFGLNGFDPSGAPVPGPNGTLGGNGFDAAGGFDAAAPGPNGTLGGNGFDVSGGAAPGPTGTLGGNGFEVAGAFDAAGQAQAQATSPSPSPDGMFGGNGFDPSGAATPGPTGTLGGNGFDVSGAAPAAGGFDAFGTLDGAGTPGIPGAPGGPTPGPHGYDGTHGGPHGGPQGGTHGGTSGFDGIHHNGGMA